MPKTPHPARFLRRLAAAAGLLSVVILTPVARTEPEQKLDARLIRASIADQAAPDLARRLDSLAGGFDGQVGIAVRDLADGWTYSFDGDRIYPQQSVSKLWVALAILDAVDRGELRLEDEVLIRRQDLSVFHQPLRKLVGVNGHRAPVRRLLFGAISQSDNTANDVLLHTAGGRAVVQRAIDSRGLKGLTASPSERDMQTETAGLEWRPEYSFDLNFWQDRDKLPLEFRRVSLDEYLAHPPDGASPEGIVEALARLSQGRLLSPASTAEFIALLEATETGPSRLKAGLPPGWRIAHKTGTGQVMGPVATGFNDVGLLTAPDGHTYAVAVMIAQTRRPVAAREALMAEVARAIAAEHDRRDQAAFEVRQAW